MGRTGSAWFCGQSVPPVMLTETIVTSKCVSMGFGRTRQDTSALFTIAEFPSNRIPEKPVRQNCGSAFLCLYRPAASPAEPQFCIEYAIYYRLLMDCDARQTENRPDTRESGAVKLYCAARCEGTSWVLPGFATGRRRNSAENSAEVLAAGARTGHRSVFRWGVS